MATPSPCHPSAVLSAAPCNHLPTCPHPNSSPFRSFSLKGKERNDNYWWRKVFWTRTGSIAILSLHVRYLFEKNFYCRKKHVFKLSFKCLLYWFGVLCLLLAATSLPASWDTTTCRNYLLISKAWKQRTKIRMGRLPFFVSADIQLIFFINNTDVTEWTTLLYVLWFIIISIFRRSESVLLICRYYHWDHG